MELRDFNDQVEMEEWKIALVHFLHILRFSAKQIETSRNRKHFDPTTKLRLLSIWRMPNNLLFKQPNRAFKWLKRASTRRKLKFLLLNYEKVLLKIKLCIQNNFKFIFLTFTGLIQFIRHDILRNWPSSEIETPWCLFETFIDTKFFFSSLEEKRFATKSTLAFSSF